MSAVLSPYLNFRGTAREALDFYQSVLGGKASSMTFADQGGMGMPDADQDLVMHGQLDGPDGLLLMASDVPSRLQSEAPTNGFSISLSGDDDATLRRWWAGLGEGATIDVPLEVAPWGDAFGMLTDRFGVSWMVNIAGVAAAPSSD